MEQMEQSTPQTPQLCWSPEVAAPTIAEVAHEARNMVTALGLYCDLLEQPGVFTTACEHYGSELRTVAAASRGLVNQLVSLCGTECPPEPTAEQSSNPRPAAPRPLSKAAHYWNEVSPTPIRDLAWELQTNRNLLTALAGPSVTLTVDALGGALPVRLGSEDFTRILVNLVKNAVEAMSGSGGRIQLVLRECQAGPGEETRLLLNIEDNGQGIAPESLERIFESGYTATHATTDSADAQQVPHRGLGLSITRSILESAGGSIRAANRDPFGACIQIELPVIRSSDR
jgi:signal transduction histidine kinase